MKVIGLQGSEVNWFSILITERNKKLQIFQISCAPLLLRWNLIDFIIRKSHVCRQRFKACFHSWFEKNHSMAMNLCWFNVPSLSWLFLSSYRRELTAGSEPTTSLFVLTWTFSPKKRNNFSSFFYVTRPIYSRSESDKKIFASSKV